MVRVSGGLTPTLTSNKPTLSSQANHSPISLFLVLLMCAALPAIFREVGKLLPKCY